jgi:hypothetical protein
VTGVPFTRGFCDRETGADVQSHAGANDAHRCCPNFTERHRLYIGPDTLMPIASVFAAVAGLVLMFWRRLVGIELVVVRVTGRPSKH